MYEALSGHVIVVMGPTGSGKGTLMAYARAKFPELHETVSCTTRSPRPGEEDGVQYYFLTQEAFDDYIEKGEFLEWAWFGSHRYGTLKKEIIPRMEAGELVLTEIEVQGVEQLRTLLPQSSMTLVYVEAGSWEALSTRAKARAPMSEEELEERHQRYLVEIQAKPMADIIIDNTADDFFDAQQAFVKVVESTLRTIRT